MLAWWRKKQLAHVSLTPGYETHALANMFPLADEAAFAAMVESIRHDGLNEPIVLYGGAILDGRNRYRACLAASVAPRFSVFEGDDEAAVRFVFSVNLARRHLNEAQRALAAARLAEVAKLTAEQAAERMSTSRASVIRAKQVLASGDAEVISLIDAGKESIEAARRRVTGKSRDNSPDAKIRRALADVRKLIDAGHDLTAETRADLARASRLFASAATARKAA